MSNSYSGKVNKTRYDNPRKPMKQTSFTVKKLGGKPSTKPLSLDSTIPVDELTIETFYHFRSSEFFNI